LTSTRHIPQEDLALYAIQALSPDENRQVQAHLDECPECRAALAEVLADAALVCMSVEQQTLPDGARQRFLARIENTAQISASVSAPRETALVPEKPRASSLGWLGWVAAVAAIAVAAYLGNHNMRLQRQLDQNGAQIAQLSAQAARAQQLMDALTSPEAKQVTLTETKQAAQPTGHATYLPNRGALIFVANHLHPIAANKTYELWLIPANGKAPLPAGLFRPDASGNASVVLPPLPEGVEAKAFGVTVEDAQGSSTPTLPIIMAGQ
jgi:Anti-sigma-K factor rskA, C-terminal/Putative zinc-finger